MPVLLVLALNLFQTAGLVPEFKACDIHAVGLLFLKHARISRKWQTISIFRAVGTYITNTFRIASIATMAVYAGLEVALLCHRYYGGMYFIVWIVARPIAIIFGDRRWEKFFGMLSKTSKTFD